MRVNRETDYALRIMLNLADKKSFTDAANLAEAADVPARFALKILRKLTAGGLTVSKKGVSGGYCLNKPPSEINMLQIIELIDGPIAIAECLCGNYVCSNTKGGGPNCAFGQVFDEINGFISEKLRSATLDSLL